jgi:valyl-tRNA synthetase
VWNADREAPRSIHKQAWPSRDELLRAEDAGSFDAAVEVLTQVRRAKSQAKVSIRFPVERLEIEASKATLALLEPVMDDVSSTLAAESYELRASSDESITTQITLGQAPSKVT